MTMVIPPCKPSSTWAPSSGGARFSPHAGFTLVELAVVLVIVGVLTGGALALLGPRLDAGREATTRERQQVLFQALQAFLLTDGRLPCPADGRLPADAPGAGRELPEGGGDCTVDPAAGVVPWVTVAVAEPTTLDGWGRRFLYAPANGLPGARLTVRGDGGFRTDEGNLTIASDPLDIPGSAVTDRAAFVLLSHGRNGDGGYLASGLRLESLPSGPGEDENQDGDRVYVDSGFNGTDAAHFDDLLLWRTKAMLRFAAAATFNAAQCGSAAALSEACGCETVPGCALGSLDAEQVCPAAVAVLDLCAP